MATSVLLACFGHATNMSRVVPITSSCPSAQTGRGPCSGQQPPAAPPRGAPSVNEGSVDSVLERVPQGWSMRAQKAGRSEGVAKSPPSLMDHLPDIFL
jgi:hypothetical protein